MTHGVRFRLGRLLPLECSAGTEPCDMGTNYACVPRGSLLGVYLSCTSYMTDLKIASYQYEYAALVEQPFGGGGARQLSAESPCGHPGHGAGVGLGWLEAALPALPARSIWAGTGTAARLRQPPLALMPPWESRRQKYPVRAFRCSPPATSKVALPLHHEPFIILAALLALLLLSSLALSFLNHLTTPDLGPSDRSSPPVKLWFSPPRRPKPRQARPKALWRRYFGRGISALSWSLYPIDTPGCVSICVNCAAAS
ncbi:hypothetical protein LI328DRAFT_171034 [Trichoderma asperelloides]|nr:hypothetical protein LI328DRAFT_171034 [Trichoderma asperelloides]